MGPAAFGRRTAGGHRRPEPGRGRRHALRLGDVVGELALIDRNALGARLESWLDASRRDGAVGSPQVADRRVARRRVGAAGQDGGGARWRADGRRDRGDLARVSRAL